MGQAAASAVGAGGGLEIGPLLLGALGRGRGLRDGVVVHLRRVLGHDPAPLARLRIGRPGAKICKTDSIVYNDISYDDTISSILPSVTPIKIQN